MKQTVQNGRKDACGITDLPIALITVQMFSTFSFSGRFVLKDCATRQTHKHTHIKVNLCSKIHME